MRQGSRGGAYFPPAHNWRWLVKELVGAWLLYGGVARAAAGAPAHSPTLDRSLLKNDSTAASSFSTTPSR